MGVRKRLGIGEGVRGGEVGVGVEVGAGVGVVQVGRVVGVGVRTGAGVGTVISSSSKPYVHKPQSPIVVVHRGSFEAEE